MASQQLVYPVREEVETDPSPATVALEDADDVVDALTSEQGGVVYACSSR